MTPDPAPSLPIRCGQCGLIGYAHDALTAELVLKTHPRKPPHVVKLPSWTKHV